MQTEAWGQSVLLISVYPTNNGENGNYLYIPVEIAGNLFN
jgi:hypothetical protein